MDNPFQSPSVLSLCPGFLGLERGLQRAIGKIRVAAYVEIEAFIVANLIAGMETGMVDAAPVWTDVKTFKAEPFRNKICGIFGGYPCQPFSLAGQRKGHEDPRHLWPHICRIIKTTEPIWCFFENVSGHLSMGYDQVYKDLRSLGFSVEAGLFTAEEVGAPHERERFFILAISERFIGYSRRKRIRWETWTNINWGSTGSTMDNTGGVRHEQKYELSTRGKGAELAGEMGNSESNNRGLSECEPGQARCEPCNSIDINRAGEKLAYPNGSRLPQQWDNAKQDEPGNHRTCNTGTAQNVDDRKPEGLERQRIYARQPQESQDWDSCKPIPNPYSANDEGAMEGRETGRRAFAADIHRWPAGPGEPQYEWEEPRTASSIIRLPNTIRKIWNHSRKGFEKMLGKEVREQIDYSSKTAVMGGLGISVNGYNFREDLLRAAGNSVVEQCAEIAFIELLKKHLRNVNRK